MSIIWAFGRNRFDSMPTMHGADTLREFAAAVLSRRAKDKASAGYVSAAFGGDGRRCAANALPRAWVALDVDGLAADALPEWRMSLTRWRGFGWPTASSTREVPRERAIIELSEPVDRAQGIGIGALILRDVAENFGAAVRIDPCGFRAEQPAFLAPEGVRPFFLLGEPLNVDVWLAQAPPAPPPPPPASADVADFADVRMRWVVSRFGEAGLLIKELPNDRGYACVCPWHRRHTTTDAPGSNATALLFPSEANGWHGAFRCLHAHCAARRLGDVVRGLRYLDERKAA